MMGWVTRGKQLWRQECPPVQSSVSPPASPKNDQSMEKKRKENEDHKEERLQKTIRFQKDDQDDQRM